MSDKKDSDKLARTALRSRTLGSRPGWTVLTALLTLATLYWLYWCTRIVVDGHGPFGTEAYGAHWGLIVANVVHLIDISHVGIAISAAVRVLRLDQYRAVARVAELVTLVALIAAVANIALDVGRPDRFVAKTVLYGNWRAPMVWSMTVIVLYLTASGVYLFLSLRSDLWRLSVQHPGWRLYRLLAGGYGGSRDEIDRYDRTLFWLALALLPIMVSVHSVYGLFFGLLVSKVGWYNPLQAPYFVLGAIVSGFSAILVVAAALRKGLGWGDILTDRMFRVFGAFLAFVTFLYLYFLISEHLTAQYFPGTAEKALSDSLLTGRYAPGFWVTVVAGLAIPFVVLFVQAVRGVRLRPGMMATAALAINAAMFFKRLLLVVPAQYQPHLPLPRPPAAYTSSYAEVVVVVGSYAFAALLFMTALKWVPITGVPATITRTAAAACRRGNVRRRTAMLASLIAGVSLILWGAATRDADFAPVKWMAGLMLLVALPLESCLIGDRRGSRGTEAKEESS